MSKYFNLKNEEMNLQITRYKTMRIKIGIHEYPDEIADKFSCLLEKVVEIKKEIVEEVIEETIIETLGELKDEVDESIVESVIEETIEEVDESIVESVIDETIEEVVENYDELSYKELKVLIKERNIIINGRKSKSKMIAALNK